MNALTQWRPSLPQTDDPALQQLRGLLAAPSLTAALKLLNPDFSVEVLHLGPTHALPDENLDIAQDWISREVALCLHERPVVWARSVCPAKGFWSGVIDCGAQSLGEQLFSGSLNATRSAFEYALLTPSHPLSKLYPRASLWARRSLFEHEGERLLLTECFLPYVTKFL